MLEKKNMDGYLFKLNFDSSQILSEKSVLQANIFTDSAFHQTYYTLKHILRTIKEIKFKLIIKKKITRIHS